jgi:hypothetical protein
VTRPVGSGTPCHHASAGCESHSDILHCIHEHHLRHRWGASSHDTRVARQPPPAFTPLSTPASVPPIPHISTVGVRTACNGAPYPRRTPPCADP